MALVLVRFTDTMVLLIEVNGVPDDDGDVAFIGHGVIFVDSLDKRGSKQSDI